MYSNEDIEKTRQLFSKFPEYTEEVSGEAISYFVLPHSQPQVWDSSTPLTPFWVYQCANTEKHVFAISDQVPEPHRKYMVFHEFVEFASNGDGDCKNALLRELEVVPFQMLPSHVRMRIEMFESLVNSGHESFRPSLEHLLELQE